MHATFFMWRATALLLAFLTANAHVEMMKPIPIRSHFSPTNVQSGSANYSMTNPLLADGSDYPCRGFQNDRPIYTTETYKAGSKYTLELDPNNTATHNGGSCQISLSYDNGKTFRVIKSIIGGCPLKHSYEFQVPSFAPSGTALLAWSWVNLTGQREFYMNCAAVEITGGPSQHHRRHARRHTWRAAKQRRGPSNDFESLPYIFKANLPPVSDCKTVEEKQVVYPHPGPDVEYGSRMSASSPVFEGKCESEGPPGPAYKDLPTTGAQPMSKASAGAGSGGAAQGGGAAGGAQSGVSTGHATPAPGGAGTPSGAPPPPAAGPPCSGNGVQCLRDGQGYAVCDGRSLHDMGNVAAGTVCKNGVIGPKK